MPCIYPALTSDSRFRAVRAHGRTCPMSGRIVAGAALVHRLTRPRPAGPRSSGIHPSPSQEPSETGDGEPGDDQTRQERWQQWWVVGAAAAVVDAEDVRALRAPNRLPA